MKIKMTTCSANPDGVNGIGSIRDVTESKAVELVAGGFAEYVGSVEDKTKDKPKGDERAVRTTPENTAERTIPASRKKSQRT